MPIRAEPTIIFTIQEGQISVTMTETLNQPVGGWTAWCLSLREISRESRAPIQRHVPPQQSPKQENSHAG
jgi:hypothetical protein